MTLTLALVVLGFAALTCGIGYLVYRQKLREDAQKPRTFRDLPNGQRIEVDPSDPTDPMHDPDVRAMLSQVLETGRPMVMNRGEEPRFIDMETQAPRVLVAHGDDSVVAVPVIPKPE